MSRQAGIVLPGYNALKVANAPTIGTATAGDTQVSVAFTAPTCVGGGAISSYTAFANCGVYRTTGASSPLVVTGLTNGTAYTFKVIATNVYGPSYPSGASNSVTPVVVTGQQAYTAAGSYTWVAPAGVTSVSAVVVGGGASGKFNGSGGAGGLAYINNYSVTPGASYSVSVGGGGISSGLTCRAAGGASSFVSSGVLGVSGGQGGCGATSAGGAVITGTGFRGGNGALSTGGAGAGGYAGIGGDSTGTTCTNGNAGAGGGGGSGASGGGSCCAFGGGGGVGILGQGSNGAGGIRNGCYVGKGGSGGANGATAITSGCRRGGDGGAYGGGGAKGPRTVSGCCVTNYKGGYGGVGAVRIIWPGTTRSFPSTNTGDL